MPSIKVNINDDVVATSQLDNIEGYIYVPEIPLPQDIEANIDIENEEIIWTMKYLEDIGIYYTYKINERNQNE